MTKVADSTVKHEKKYLKGWDSAVEFTKEHNLIPISNITQIYMTRGYSFACGWEAACNHYITKDTLDEPDNLPW